MNIIRKTTAATAALVLSLGFALPAAALDLDATVNSATQGTVNVGGTKANTNANVGVDVNVGANGNAGGSSTTSGGSAQGSADATATMETTAAIEIAPLIITRGDVDAGTVQATVSAPSSVKTRADLSGYVAGQMKADANLSSVEAASDNVAVMYKQHARLFGFIPVTVNATANVDASGNVTVSYPWYAFLMATNKSDLEAKIQSRVTTDLNANVNAQAEAATQLSADAQAKVIAAVQAAMEAEFSAEANASAGASANVQ